MNDQLKAPQAPQARRAPGAAGRVVFEHMPGFYRAWRVGRAGARILGYSAALWLVGVVLRLFKMPSPHDGQSNRGAP